MIELAFIFNEKLVKRDAIDKEEFLKEMRQYAKENSIEEVKYGVFQKDGEDALCIFLKFVTGALHADSKYMKYLKKLILNDDGNKEDCIEEEKIWMSEHAYL